MNLPKIAAPTYELTIPSSGKSVTYRPYLSKEEKMLMMAKESGNADDIAASVTKLIEACVDGVDDATKLTVFDFEYIFVKLRSVSVGELAMPRIKCGDVAEDENACTQQIILPVDFGKLEPTHDPKHTNKIVLSDDGIGVIMKYPTLGLAMSNKTTSAVEQTYDMIISCIDSIFDGEKTYPASESSHEELVEFVDSLQSPMTKKIQDEFFATMPTIEYDIETTCKKCGKTHKFTLKGIDDFF